jgi:serine phosphatase RsbU (regulator of sigma subunit)
MIFSQRFFYGFLLLFLSIITSESIANIKVKFIGIKPKSSDTIEAVNIFERYVWDTYAYKGNQQIGKYLSCSPDTISFPEDANRIFLRQTFEFDTLLVGKTYVLRYYTYSKTSLKMNGKKVLETGQPGIINYLKRQYRLEDKNIYFSIPKKKITFEVEVSPSFFNFDSKESIELLSLTYKDEIEKKSKTDGMEDISVLFFYLAIGLILITQFIYFKKLKENLYFSLFCVCIAIVIGSDYIDLPFFVGNMITFSIGFSMHFLACFLSVVLSEKERTQWPLLIISVVLFLYAVLQIIFPYISFSITFGIINLLFIVYHLFVCIYLLFQGGTKKKWEVKYITYGFIAWLVIIVILMFTSAYASDSEIYNKTVTMSFLMFPMIIGVISGKRNGLNQQQMIEQLDEIEKLSMLNLAREKEKQQMLANQNIILEEKVIARTTEVVKQKELLELKNKEITESIEYALLIQSAILPQKKIVRSYLKDSFILYKPKDIVAGDFYWMESVMTQDLSGEVNNVNYRTSENIIIFAACDCTGHGVPGALVSVVCYNALNRAVREFGLTEPAKILDKTAQLVADNFSQSEEKIKDGMDVSICALNTHTKELKWAGANNPLWICRNGTIIDTRADKQSIGINEDMHPFTPHQFKLEYGDILYLFSDGYADQFSSNDKKLMKKNFKELLLSIQDKNMDEQSKHLDTFITDWRGNMAQTDDILVIGVKIM